MTKRAQTAADADAGQESIDALMERIDAIIARMDAPNAPLESLIGDFESGMALTRRAQSLLADAEQRVEILLGDTDTDADGGE